MWNLLYCSLDGRRGQDLVNLLEQPLSLKDASVGSRHLFSLTSTAVTDLMKPALVFKLVLTISYRTSLKIVSPVVQISDFMSSLVRYFLSVSTASPCTWPGGDLVVPRSRNRPSKLMSILTNSVLVSWSEIFLYWIGKFWELHLLTRVQGIPFGLHFTFFCNGRFVHILIEMIDVKCFWLCWPHWHLYPVYKKKSFLWIICYYFFMFFCIIYSVLWGCEYGKIAVM